MCEENIVKSDSYVGLYFKLFDRQFLFGSQDFLRGDRAVELEFAAANDFLTDADALLFGQSAAAKLLAFVADDGVGAESDLELVPARCIDTSGRAADRWIVGEASDSSSAKVNAAGESGSLGSGSSGVADSG